MKAALLPLQLEVIKDMLQLPESYDLSFIGYDGEHQELCFLVRSDELPDTPAVTSNDLPTMYLHVKREFCPDVNPYYRHETITPKLGKVYPRHIEWPIADDMPATPPVGIHSPESLATWMATLATQVDYCLKESRALYDVVEKQPDPAISRSCWNLSQTVAHAQDTAFWLNQARANLERK